MTERKPRTHKNSLPGGRNPSRSESGRLYHGGKYGRRKDQRGATAIECRYERDQRSPEEQIAVLDSRLGVGVGAVRERARLQAQIEAKATESAGDEA